MAYTTIDKPSDYFNIVQYTGNAGTQAITGVGFSPNWVWGKARNAAEGHAIHDTIRGVRKNVLANTTAAEEDIASITAFGSDGFTLGSNAHLNNNNSPTVAWCWKAETAFSNDASSTSIGSVDSAGTVNDTAGFSIVSWTGTGANATVKHGLSTAPSWILVKNRGAVENWVSFHTKLGNGLNQKLNNTEANQDTTGSWNDTSPTTSVFTVGSFTNVNQSSTAMIAYCFAEKQGYSKFGSYKGNGNANGTFVYTGFKPAWVLLKRSDATQAWELRDNQRENPYNTQTGTFYVNEAGAADQGEGIDMLANGFKCRAAGGGQNANGAAYIYMAFAESPFVSSTNIPATAR